MKTGAATTNHQMCLFLVYDLFQALVTHCLIDIRYEVFDSIDKPAAAAVVVSRFGAVAFSLFLSMFFMVCTSKIHLSRESLSFWVTNIWKSTDSAQKLQIAFGKMEKKKNERNRKQQLYTESMQNETNICLNNENYAIIKWNCGNCITAKQ